MARRYALIIGIQDYQQIAPLTKTREDARSMADFLRATGDFQDVFVVRSDATQKDLVAALKRFQEQARGNDALVYFTGHGFGLVDELTDGVTGYLAAVDTRVVTTGNRVTAQQDGIPLASLGALLEQGDFSSLVMLLDACHSGLLLERGAIEQGLAVFNRQRDYFLITACRGFEQAAAIGDQPHSLFTGAVLRGLARENADDQGQVSADRLFDFVARSLRESGQEPLRLGMGSGIGLVEYGVAGPVVRAVSEENPYQGLAAFTKETRQFFFGRDSVVDDLVLKLQGASFVPLFGASGSGKSSVVRAGLVPRLEAMGWQILGPMKPGPEPIMELKRSFDAVFERKQLGAIYQQIETEGLKGIVAQLPAKRYLLVIDQFEEVFTLREERAKQRQFIELLMGLEVDDRLSIVTTMRSDFVEAWQAHGDLVSILQGDTVWMPPLEGNDLRNAIVQPAKVQGYEFSDGLETLILEHVSAEPNALPLLEFALEKLWDRRDQSNNQLTVAVYEEMGSLMGALNRYATDWYKTLTATNQTLVQRVMLALVRVGMGSQDTRWRRKLKDVLALGDRKIENIVDLLDEKRLIVKDGCEVDLAHERLMEGWKLFAEWRQIDREIRYLANRVEELEEEWEKHGCQDSFLAPEGLVKQINSKQENIEQYLREKTLSFLQKSHQYHCSLGSVIQWTKSETAFNARAEDVLREIEANLSEGSFNLIRLIQDEVDIFGEPVGKTKEVLYFLRKLLNNPQEFHISGGWDILIGSISLEQDPDVDSFELSELSASEEPIEYCGYTPENKLIAFGRPGGNISFFDLNGDLLRKISSNINAEIIKIKASGEYFAVFQTNMTCIFSWVYEKIASIPHAEQSRYATSGFEWLYALMVMHLF
jgi:energy-coupling factor transporter ATP-binding protein EcfA2